MSCEHFSSRISNTIRLISRTSDVFVFMFVCLFVLWIYVCVFVFVFVCCVFVSLYLCLFVLGVCAGGVFTWVHTSQGNGDEQRVHISLCFVDCVRALLSLLHPATHATHTLSFHIHVRILTHRHAHARTHDMHTYADTHTHTLRSAGWDFTEHTHLGAMGWRANLLFSAKTTMKEE